MYKICVKSEDSKGNPVSALLHFQLTPKDMLTLVDKYPDITTDVEKMIEELNVISIIDLISELMALSYCVPVIFSAPKYTTYTNKCYMKKDIHGVPYFVNFSKTKGFSNFLNMLFTEQNIFVEFLRGILEGADKYDI